MKKRIIVGFVLILLLKALSYAQSPNWSWEKIIGGNQEDDGRAITSDSHGNIYVTGEFKSPMLILDNDSLVNDSVYTYDIFILKYNMIGQLLWSKRVGGKLNDYAMSITTDNLSNIYITGNFLSPVIFFDSIMLQRTQTNYNDFFISKFDSTGKVLWAKSAMGNLSDGGNSIILDKEDNIYIAGYFQSPIFIIDTITLTNNNGYPAIFISKFDNNGNILWAKSAGGLSYDYSYSITCDTFNNCYVTGGFSSQYVMFDSITLMNYSSGKSDIFIAKYSSFGNILWAKSFGGSSYDYGTSITIDKIGHIYLTGFFSSPTIAFETTNFTNNGPSDLFLIKVDQNGSLIWAKKAGGTNEDKALSVYVDDIGVYIVGYFYSQNINFGSNVLYNSSPNSYCDMFITKYDFNGNSLWAKKANAIEFDAVKAITKSNFNSIYILGTFWSPYISFNQDTFSNLGNFDVFLVKLDEATLSSSFSFYENIFEIFPNPSNGVFSIRLNENQKEELSILITDIFGNEMYKSKLNHSIEMLDLHKLKSGIYFIKGLTNKSSIHKLIIQN